MFKIIDADDNVEFPKKEIESLNNRVVDKKKYLSDCSEDIKRTKQSIITVL